MYIVVLLFANSIHWRLITGVFETSWVTRELAYVFGRYEFSHNAPTKHARCTVYLTNGVTLYLMIVKCKPTLERIFETKEQRFNPLLQNISCISLCSWFAHSFHLRHNYRNPIGMFCVILWLTPEI